MIELTSLERIIAKLLVDSAINKSGNYSYSELSEILENEYGEKVNPHYGLSYPLGNISALCYELGLPLLSVRVQYKNDTTGKTAEGFYAIACNLKPEYKAMTPTDVRKQELQLTRTCESWQLLLDYLGDRPVIIATKEKRLTIAEQMAAFVDYIIGRFGIGHQITKKEIEGFFAKHYKTAAGGVIPADHCYNRINKGNYEDRSTYFEYISDGLYRVWGGKYPFNGPIYSRPRGGEDSIVGYCIEGKRIIGPLPIYPDELPNDSPEYREGKQKIVQVNTYERNPAARQACINHYGATCHICGFDFAAVYGADFEGIIHVHHLKMVSEADSEYTVNPVDDLRPVCPNCHMILHSKKEGYTINEVKAMINR